MNKSRLQYMPFIYLLLPYAHLSLVIDYYLHSLAGIIGSIIITVFIGFYAKRNHQLHLLIGLNMINLSLSYLLTRIKGIFQTPHVIHSPHLTITLLMLLFLASQAVGVFWGGVLYKR